MHDDDQLNLMEELDRLVDKIDDTIDKSSKAPFEWWDDPQDASRSPLFEVVYQQQALWR